MIRESSNPHYDPPHDPSGYGTSNEFEAYATHQEDYEGSEGWESHQWDQGQWDEVLNPSAYAYSAFSNSHKGKGKSGGKGKSKGKSEGKGGERDWKGKGGKGKESKGGRGTQPYRHDRVCDAIHCTKGVFNPHQFCYPCHQNGLNKGFIIKKDGVKLPLSRSQRNDNNPTQYPHKPYNAFDSHHYDSYDNSWEEEPSHPEGSFTPEQVGFMNGMMRAWSQQGDNGGDTLTANAATLANPSHSQPMLPPMGQATPSETLRHLMAEQQGATKRARFD
jgi:hypothetical protein